MGHRRALIVQPVSYIVVIACAAFGLALAEPPVRKPAEWPNYGADTGNSKYSPLDHIRKENVDQLRIVWRWRSIDDQVQQQNPKLMPWLFEATPLMIGSMLYVSTPLGQVAALEAATGELIW